MGHINGGDPRFRKPKIVHRHKSNEPSEPVNETPNYDFSPESEEVKTPAELLVSTMRSLVRNGELDYRSRKTALRHERTKKLFQITDQSVRKGDPRIRRLDDIEPGNWTIDLFLNEILLDEQGNPLRQGKKVSIQRDESFIELHEYQSRPMTEPEPELLMKLNTELSEAAPVPLETFEKASGELQKRELEALRQQLREHKTQTDA